MDQLLSIVCRSNLCHVDSCTGYVPLTSPDTQCECDCHTNGDLIGADLD